MQTHKTYSWFFFLCAAEGLVALFGILLIPSEGGSISPFRFALLGIILAICIAWIYFGLRPVLDLEKIARPAFIIFSALLALVWSLLLFFVRYLTPERFLPIYERLSPLLWYLLFLSIQMFFALLYIKNGFRLEVLAHHKSTYISALIAFGCSLFVFLFIAVTRLGVTVDPAYWAEPGVAILGWQFVLALLDGIIVLSLSLYLKDDVLDILVPVLIYSISVCIWLSVPLDVLRNGFYVTMDPPTFQPFPYSDAGYYDQMAQSLLIGHPYLGGIPTRPLYIVFLAFLHILFGENYPRIIIGQTFLLALIPVVFYFLGKKLHSRIAGVTVALFFSFRELTSLLLTSSTRVTNTKSLLVDLPTLFLLILSCFFTVRWFERKDSRSAFIAGGMFGLLLLLRTQSMLLLPVLILVALLALGWRNKLFYQSTAVFIVGIAVAVLPWLIHNYLQTGEVAFDAAFQYKVIASQYAYSGNLDLVNYDFKGKGLATVLVEFTLKDPKFVFGFITNHFLATEVNSLLALPLIKSYNGIFAPINMYWLTWDGSLEWYNTLLLVFYLGVIALGLGAAWRRWRWIGLVPLAYNIGYALATAIGRFSGWRYDFPADWIAYFYLGIGFAEAVILGSLLFGAKAETNQESADQQNKRLGVPAIALMFILVGALPWMATGIAAPRYPDQSLKTLEQKIAVVSNVPAVQDIQAFAAQPEAIIQIGRVLYPRYYSRGNGLSSSNPWPAYKPRDYSRLGFLFMNQVSSSAVFPTRKIPTIFPHAADAIILGCRREDYVEVRLIVFPELDVALLSAPLTEPCSP
ncbi:MAG: glycosyltransferase family 39 protein [Chloroflexota bacterium]